MDRLTIKLIENEPSNGIVVRIDGEAAELLNELVEQSGATRKQLVSEMIRFCYPRIEVERIKVRFGGEV